MTKPQRDEWMRWAIGIGITLLISLGSAWVGQWVAVGQIEERLIAVRGELAALTKAVDTYNRVQDDRMTEIKGDAQRERDALASRVSQLERRR